MLYYAVIQKWPMTPIVHAFQNEYIMDFNELHTFSAMKP